MKILLVAYPFPPFHDAQAIRWYYLSNALAELGVEVDVVTVKHPRASDGIWEFHPNLKIHRVYAGPIESFSLRVKSGIRVDDPGNRELRQSLGFRTMKSIYWAGRRLAGHLLPGDVRTEWFPYAAGFIREKLSKEAYACMITSHEPCVDSLLGLYLKKRHPSLRWVADFGDPYVAPYTPRHKLWLENRLERAIYGNADVLMFTNPNVARHLRGKYGFLSDRKMIIVGQGFSQGFCEESESTPRKRDGEGVFTLIYTGTLYRGFRDSSALAEALSMLEFPFRFLLAGKNEAFIKDFATLGERFEFLGFIDHFSSLRLQRESDVLVHIGNDNSIQIPGKIYEYLGALKPVLSICHDPEDPSGRLVRELNRGVSCMNNPRSIKTAIETLYNDWRRNGLDFTFDCKGVYEYSWERRARTVHEKLQRD
jgi:hypothetical protein